MCFMCVCVHTCIYVHIHVCTRMKTRADAKFLPQLLSGSTLTVARAALSLELLDLTQLSNPGAAGSHWSLFPHHWVSRARHPHSVLYMSVGEQGSGSDVHTGST